MQSAEEDPWLLVLGARMREVRERASVLARQRDTHVLVVGEPGSGRHTLAGIIHRASARRNATLVNFDGTGLPTPLILSELFGHLETSFAGAYRAKRGIVWKVHGGSLVVKDADRLPLDAQAALEAFARTGQVVPIGARDAIGSVNVRLFATTHARPAHAAEEGEFLRGLYNQLRGQEVVMPPLRARGEDILELFYHFMKAAHGAAPVKRLASDAAGLLITHRWPGNVPELRAIAGRLARHPLGLITAGDVARELALYRPKDNGPLIHVH